LALYSDLASVYDFMYQKLFDYEKECQFYLSQLESFHCKSIIEFGCGTGNLGQNIINAGYHYHGVDISPAMIELAKKKIPDNKLSVGDIVNYRSENTYDAACFTGRSISYLTDEEKIIKAFETVFFHLKPNGIFIFDPIDGDLLFENFDTNEKIVEVSPYLRYSQSTPIDYKLFTWRWNAAYFIQEENNIKKIGTDVAILRAFNAESLSPLLSQAGFEIIHIIAKTSYIWDDHYYICRKNKGIENDPSL
jgi:SAM-dependent methyltransferase